MTQEDLRKLFDLSLPPCSEAVEWASKQEDQSVGGLLAACERPDWRGFVAQYSRSIVILGAMAGDGDKGVREQVASNRSTPTAILEGLAKDKDEGVRGWVARNPNTPTVVLEELAKDESPWVRGGVARNPGASAVILERLAEDEDEWVQGVAVSNFPLRNGKDDLAYR